MKFETWWNRYTRIVTFNLGVAILLYETIFKAIDRPWLLGAAIALVGPTAARWVENILSRPPEPQPPTPSDAAHGLTPPPSTSPSPGKGQH